MVRLTEQSVLSKTKASELKNVKRLNCWANELTDISVVRKMPNISIVCLSVNNILSLADFANCANLEELYVRKNNIANISELYHLESLPKLRVLWLDGSPCSSETNYRLRVLRILPRLHKLDNIAVDEDELSQAMVLSPDPRPTTLSSNHKTLQSPNEKQSPCSESRLILASENKPSPPTTRRPLLPRDDIDSPTGSILPPAGTDPNGYSKPDDSDETCHCASGDSGVEVSVKPEQQVVKEKQGAEQFVLPWNSTCNIADQLAIEQMMEESCSTSQSKEPQHSIRVASVLQAALCLVTELEQDGLEIVADAVRNRLQSLQ